MKMIRKNKVCKILPMVALFLLVGCEDLDFLDPNNPTTDNPVSIQTLVAGSEAGLRVDIGVYLRDLLVVGREAYYLEPADPRYTGELLRGPVDPGGFLANRPWNANYDVIQNCIALMNHADADSGAMGFASTIHAYCLLRLISLTDVNGARLNYDGEISTAISTKAEVYTAIETLLDDGWAYLGSGQNSSALSFTLSTGFTGFDSTHTFAKFNRALRARVAVHQSEWNTALTALGNSFLDESGDLDMGVFHVFSTGSNDQGNEMYEAWDADFVKLMVHPSYAADVESGDGRYADKVSERPEELPRVTYDGLVSTLAPIIWSSDLDPIPIIRNEELILLKAEADIAGGATGGLTEINIVRAAHGLAGAGAGGLTQLLHEKRYSLLFEGQRLVDMRHYDKTGDLPLDRTGETDVPDDAIVTFPIPETETPG